MFLQNFKEYLLGRYVLDNSRPDSVKNNATNRHSLLSRVKNTFRNKGIPAARCLIINTFLTENYLSCLYASLH